MRSLILGGARSGKSGYAESLALCAGGPVLYVATARPDPTDRDFAARIAQHRERRPSTWSVDDSSDLVECLTRIDERRQGTGDDAEKHFGAIIVDDLGTWVTAQFDQHDGWDATREEAYQLIVPLVDVVRRFPSERMLLMVTPEVGMGVIPEHHSGRLFRDTIGRLNADLADAMDEVVLVVAGQPLHIKTAG